MLYWIIVGIIARWLAGKLVHCEGFGLIGDLILGLIGGLVGGSLFGALGELVAQEQILGCERASETQAETHKVDQISQDP